MEINLPKDPINEIIKFSIKNEKLIREEFKKMIEYFSNNMGDLLNVVNDIKNNINPIDYFSQKILDGAEQITNNLGGNEFIFCENLLLDSLEKINKQIKQLPEDVINHMEVVKIYFYDLSMEPDPISGSHFILSVLKINWNKFNKMYMSINN